MLLTNILNMNLSYKQGIIMDRLEVLELKVALLMSSLTAAGS